MALLDLLTGRKAFSSHAEIRTAAADRYPSRRENFANARLLLIFAGTQPKTWLLATQDGLYLVMDSLKEDQPRAVWRIDRSDLMQGNQLAPPIRVHDYTDSTGKVQFGEKPVRSFTRDLFTDIPIDHRVHSFLQAAFGEHA